MCGIKKSPRSEVAVPHSGACEVRRLLAGATALLLRVPRRCSGPPSVVGCPRPVPESGVHAVRVSRPAHLAEPKVLGLVGAGHERSVHGKRVGVGGQLLQNDGHFGLLLFGELNNLYLNYTK